MLEVTGVGGSEERGGEIELRYCHEVGEEA